MEITQFENERWESMEQPIEFRHRAAAAMAQGTVLDVGCGDGVLLTLLKEGGVSAIGADISEVAIEKCRRKGFQVEEIRGDTLPFPDVSFDTVIALDVLEHLYRPEVLLREMKRVSKKSIIIGVPNFCSLPARMQVMFGRVPENNQPKKGHIYWFTRDVLISLAQGEGLSVVDFRANTIWEHVPGVASLTRLASHIMPGVFGLSFVVRLELQ